MRREPDDHGSAPATGRQSRATDEKSAWQPKEARMTRSSWCPPGASQRRSAVADALPFLPPPRLMVGGSVAVDQFSDRSASALAARFPGSAATGSHGADDAARAAGGDGLAPAFWTAFRRSANAMVLVDRDRRIVAGNEAAANLAGRPVRALVGAGLRTLLDDPSEALDETTWRARVDAGESYGRRRIRRADGSTVQIEFAMRAATVD